MQRARFEAMAVLRREWETDLGRSELCRAADGTLQVRLCLYGDACQREYLTALGADLPARLERDGLELLLPCRDGVPLKQWLYEHKPTLAQRRDACLSLLTRLLEDGMPPCLVAPSALTENLLFTDGGAALQYLPDLSLWRKGLTQAEAVRSVAGLVREVLTRGVNGWQQRCFPEELTLLCLRAEGEDYLDWGQLQRDVAALPDDLPHLGAYAQTAIRRLKGLARRWAMPAACALAALLLAAALLSMAGAYRQWRSERQQAWPGMTPVGEQELDRGVER